MMRNLALGLMIGAFMLAGCSSSEETTTPSKVDSKITTIDAKVATPDAKVATPDTKVTPDALNWIIMDSATPHLGTACTTGGNECANFTDTPFCTASSSTGGKGYCTVQNCNANCVKGYKCCYVPKSDAGTSMVPIPTCLTQANADALKAYLASTVCN